MNGLTAVGVSSGRDPGFPDSASLARVSNLDREHEVACQAARDAGRVILDYYGNPELVVDTKPDTSPVTAADKAADALILDRLRTAFPGDAFLTEESPDDASRFGKSRVWIIDPLDGTRDFIAQTGDFSVHIGLCVEEQPVLGVVYQPVRQALYHARRGGGAFLESSGVSTRIHTSTRREPGELRVGISRLNPDEGLGKCLAASGLAPARGGDGRLGQAHGARARRSRRRPQPLARRAGVGHLRARGDPASRPAAR